MPLFSHKSCEFHSIIPLVFLFRSGFFCCIAGGHKNYPVTCGLLERLPPYYTLAITTVRASVVKCTSTHTHGKTCGMESIANSPVWLDHKSSPEQAHFFFLASRTTVNQHQKMHLNIASSASISKCCLPLLSPLLWI